MKPEMVPARIQIGIVLILLVAGCAQRDRDNPLDPRNSDTGGRPGGFRLYAMERAVYLSWTPLPLRDIDALYIYRRVDGLDFDRHLVITDGRSSAVDRDIEYGVRYEYYVTVQSGGSESPPSETITVTAGPTYTWVADYQTGYASCLSHDLGSLVGSYGLLFYPQVIAASPGDGAAWVAARFESQLYKIGHRGELLAMAPDLPSIVDLAVDTTFLDVWVAQSDPGRLLRLDRTGVVRAYSGLVTRPAALAVSAHGGACWAVDSGDGHLKCFNLYGERTVRSEETLRSPRDLVLAESSGVIWVADSSAIVQFDFSGRATGVRLGPFYEIDRLAWDDQRRILYAVDVERVGVPARLYRMDEQGRVLWSSDRFSFPRGLAVNRTDGSCLVGDAGYDHYGLFRVDASDASIVAIDPFILPVSIDIEYH